MRIWRSCQSQSTVGFDPWSSLASLFLRRAPCRAGCGSETCNTSPGFSWVGIPRTWEGERSWRGEHLDVGSRYVLDKGSVTPSTLTVALSSSNLCWPTSKQSDDSVRFGQQRDTLPFLEGTRSPSSFQGTFKWWAANWLGTTAAGEETLQGSVLSCFILIEKLRANLVSRKPSP